MHENSIENLIKLYSIETIDNKTEQFPHLIPSSGMLLFSSRYYGSKSTPALLNRRIGAKNNGLNCSLLTFI